MGAGESTMSTHTTLTKKWLIFLQSVVILCLLNGF